MSPFEFVTTEDERDEVVLPFPSGQFALGVGADVDVALPAALTPAALELRVDVRVVSEQGIEVHARRGALAIDGQPTSRGPLKVGQVLRVGPLGLLLRRAGALSPTSFKAPAAEVGFEKTAASAMLPPGTLVAGRYEVVARLASGAMGDVYRVEHKLLRKSFALKVMKPALSKDPDFVARFEREAIATTRIGQQNIIEVVDFGQTDGGQFYFVMEFLDGQTLASLLYRHGPLPVHRVLKLGVQVARALSASHEMGVVHRDLKPENVMVIERPGDPDFVKVLDFGVAKVANDAGGVKQTTLGMIIGTPQYMAPEQAVGQPADARTDIYALGLILYELAVGKPVFEGETPSDLMLKHTSTPPPAFQPGPLNDVPDGLEALVLKMLAKLPAARPSTMREVIGVLEDLEFELAGPRLPRPRDTQPTARLPKVEAGAPEAVSATGERPTQKLASGVGARTTLERPLPIDRAPRRRGPMVLGGVASLLVGLGLLVTAFGWSQPARPSADRVSVGRAAEPPDAEVPPADARQFAEAQPLVSPGPAELPATHPSPPEVPRQAAPVPSTATVIEAPPTAPPAQALRTTLHITSTPVGATIVIDGKPLGRAPLDWDVSSAGPHTLKASAPGFVDATLSLTAASGPQLQVVLKKALPRDLKDPFAAPENPDLRDPFGDTP